MRLRNYLNTDCYTVRRKFIYFLRTQNIVETFFLDLQTSGNYTCRAANSNGVASLTHVIHLTSQPDAPSIVINHVSQSTLNISVLEPHDGGAPILG